MRARRRATLALLVFAALAPSLAPSRAAADVTPSAEDDAVFRNGLDQYAHGNNVGAIATWESLLATLGVERGYKVLYNLGLAYQAIGDITRAIERYGAFVKQVGARTEVPRELADRAADAQSRLEQLERSHGAVNVRAPSRGGLVLTRIGTAEPRAAGYVVWLAPGHHDVEIFVGTDHVKKVRVDVLQGQTVDVDTSPPEAPPDPSPSAAARPPSDGDSKKGGGGTERSSTWIWIGAGATAVSFALPITFFVVASDKRNKAETIGPGGSGYADARSTFDTWRTLQYVAYALPAALALATVGYVLLRPAAGARVTASVGLGGAAIRGDF